MLVLLWMHIIGILKVREMGYIYRIWNIYNNKSYVGQTTKIDPLDRIDQHLYGSRLGSIVVQRAILKHGINKFRYEIIKRDVPNELLDLYEIKYIRRFVSHHNGYNLTVGGNQNMLGYKHTDETKRKMRVSHQGMAGKRHSETTKRKMSEVKIGSNNSNYGKPTSRKQKETVSSIMKGNKHAVGHKWTEERRCRGKEVMMGKQYALGYRHTEEAKHKISEAGFGRKHTEEAKRKISKAATEQWARWKRENL